MTTTKAINDILAERERQTQVKGHSHSNDDAYTKGELANAAACYAMRPDVPERDNGDYCPRLWPWDFRWWKPGCSSYAGRRRDLVKAAALLLAEIERLDRAEERANTKNI